MHPLIRLAAALILLFLASLSVLAEPRSFRPVRTRFYHFHRTEELGDQILLDSGKLLSSDKNSGSTSEKTSVEEIRICSCQVLNLQSSNYNHHYVVLLAEKTNDQSSGGFRAARIRIEKEKKQLKKLFYDKVKLVAELHGNGSCKSMYFRLRTTDSQLQLYEILNAD